MTRNRRFQGMVFGAVLAALFTPLPSHAQSAPDLQEVKRIVDHRCVVCHSCYDAPCQLKLTSPEGLARGGSKLAVYHTERLEDARPTRLGIDAQTVPEWRALGFHTVTRDPTADAPSLLERYLELGRQNPLPTDGPVPEVLGLALDRALACPTPSEFDQYKDTNPLAGMPYAAAPLQDPDYETLIAWAQSGKALPPAPAEIPDDIADQITAWEAFLNTADLRHQLMSRYLYEHLFLARLHFSGGPDRLFFQVVRSTAPPGEEIDIIATRRPFDSPGEDDFYYRLQMVIETIVHKEHLVYTLNPARMDRYRQLFLNPDWTLTALPPYGDAEGGDPFTTYAVIPPRSRYQFLLDEALFFVRSFIRGPVCHGETAVDVIEDRFWVSFLDPDSDLSITDPTYLQDGAPTLDLPVSKVDSGLLGDLQGFSHQNQTKYLEFRDARYRASPAHQTGFGYDAIWDGDGTNPSALITVFRHFDNASAMTGLHGAIPETAWVIDYPIFERIYYDLVAGYDVFGRVEHQLATRLYMDELRMEGEDAFLAFMPQGDRRKMHDEWYKGTLAQWHTYWHQRRVDDKFPTGITYATDQPKQEFFETLLARGNGLWPERDPINRCDDDACAKGVSGALSALASQHGDWVRYLPDLSVLAVEGTDGTLSYYTLAHDKAHDNVAFLFNEAARRDPADDVLTILPGFFASYPNFFFHLRSEELPVFVNEITAITSQEAFVVFLNQYGIRRTSPEFWTLSDEMNAKFLQQDPVQAGIFDLNRYKDPKTEDDPT